ncbi:MAG: hypothetical protein K8F92_08825 [Hyphomicrobium sp.]|uniref:hypothetical protein n=1 Tax=Hyphomicrobium sp. TaxID=82 RepID=UPI001322E967|nr:hypothetical protein [Hyphomicrobium sp.]KAB2943540.1 MAG: hypothetical protein F9K20_02355 [Hyphomicrobium sp.]MBZ0209746.1 hypothetical protein [Hyphomicrobium sp.]
MTTPEASTTPIGRRLAAFLFNHGAPIVLSGLLLYVLWWGHSPQLQTVDAAMWHVSWVGVIALLYIALQARAVLAQPRSGVMHAMIEILISLLPLFVVVYAFVDWMRGVNLLSIFQVIVMVQATMVTLIDVVIFTWFSLSLSRLSVHTIDVR